MIKYPVSLEAQYVEPEPVLRRVTIRMDEKTASTLCAFLGATNFSSRRSDVGRSVHIDDWRVDKNIDLGKIYDALQDILKLHNKLTGDE